MDALSAEEFGGRGALAASALRRECGDGPSIVCGVVVAGCFPPLARETPIAAQPQIGRGPVSLRGAVQPQ